MKNIKNKDNCYEDDNTNDNNVNNDNIDSCKDSRNKIYHNDDDDEEEEEEDITYRHGYH